jgi:hypothetical protein
MLHKEHSCHADPICHPAYLLAGRASWLPEEKVEQEKVCQLCQGIPHANPQADHQVRLTTRTTQSLCKSA